MKVQPVSGNADGALCLYSCRYFLHQWPSLCIFACGGDGDPVATIVAKVGGLRLCPVFFPQLFLALQCYEASSAGILDMDDSRSRTAAGVLLSATVSANPRD